MRKHFGRILLLLVAAAIVPACGGGGSSGGGGLKGTRVANLTFSARGGNGSATGAGGGSLGLQLVNGAGSNTFILKKGKINVAFKIPENLNAFLGDNPRTVTGNVTLTPVAAFSATPATARTEVLQGVTTGSIMGDDGVNPATGLWIQDGATLTIPPHFDPDDASPATGPFEEVYLTFAGSIIIEGSLVIGSKDGTDDGADLFIDSFTVIVHADGSIVNDGETNAAGTDGGSGGSVSVSTTSTSILIFGTITTTGGSGDNGGNGGEVALLANFSLWFTGTINADGGLAIDAAGVGGNGGPVTLQSGTGQTFGGTFSSGNISSRGANGPVGGGDGGPVLIGVDPSTGVGDQNTGDCASSGDVNNTGGNATTLGNGGNGGGVGFSAFNGTLRIIGTLQVSGGAGSGATGDGGDSGIVQAINSAPLSGLLIGPNGAGTFVGIEVFANGGTGQDGGIGGGMLAGTIYDGATDFSSQFDMYVVGYNSFDLSGGNGGTDGGDAAGGSGIVIGNLAVFDASTNVGGCGSLTMDVPIIATGGSGTTATGGNGPAVQILTQTGSLINSNSTLSYKADMDISGGNGGTTGGSAGTAQVVGHKGVEFIGDMTANGGTGGTGIGGNPPSTVGLIVLSEGLTVFKSDVVSTGGTSTSDDGGAGGTAAFVGHFVKGSGTATLNGGNSNGGAAGDDGGNGGTALILSTANASDVNFTATVPGGGATGAGVAGPNGIFIIDGVVYSGP